MLALLLSVVGGYAFGIALTKSTGPLKVSHEAQAVCRLAVASICWGCVVDMTTGGPRASVVGPWLVSFCSGLCGTLENTFGQSSNKESQTTREG